MFSVFLIFVYILYVFTILKLSWKQKHPQSTYYRQTSNMYMSSTRNFLQSQTLPTLSQIKLYRNVSNPQRKLSTLQINICTIKSRINQRFLQALPLSLLLYIPKFPTTVFYDLRLWLRPTLSKSSKRARYEARRKRISKS